MANNDEQDGDERMKGVNVFVTCNGGFVDTQFHLLSSTRNSIYDIASFLKFRKYP